MVTWNSTSKANAIEPQIACCEDFRAELSVAGQGRAGQGRAGQGRAGLTLVVDLGCQQGRLAQTLLHGRGSKSERPELLRGF